MLRVRVSTLEKRQLEDLAAQAGLTLSDFMRNRSLGSKPRTIKATPEEAVFIKGLAEIGKLASNVNQIAKALNTIAKRGDLFTVPTEQINRTLDGLDALAAFITKLMEQDGYSRKH